MIGRYTKCHLCKMVLSPGRIALSIPTMHGDQARHWHICGRCVSMKKIKVQELVQRGQERIKGTNDYPTSPTIQT